MNVNCKNCEIVCHTNTNIAVLAEMPASGGLTCCGVVLCVLATPMPTTSIQFPNVTCIDENTTKMKHSVSLVSLLYFKTAGLDAVLSSGVLYFCK